LLEHAISNRSNPNSNIQLPNAADTFPEPKVIALTDTNQLFIAEIQNIVLLFMI
jgi:hypothetical protein